MGIMLRIERVPLLADRQTYARIEYKPGLRQEAMGGSLHWAWKLWEVVIVLKCRDLRSGAPRTGTYYYYFDDRAQWVISVNYR